MTADPLLRRDTPLAMKLKDVIRRDGPMPLQFFMSSCLWDEDFGYYRRQPVFGTAGDFITSAEISQVFGELIGIWAGVVWQTSLRGVPAVTLAEYGPGRGTMMRDALRAARIVPGFAPAAGVRLIEASESLRHGQAQTLAEMAGLVTWGSDMADVAPPAIILANEFLDAWPAAQWVMTPDGWRANGVGLDSRGDLQFVALNGEVPHGLALDPSASVAVPGSVVETQRLDQFAEGIAAIASRGPVAALIIDYGYTSPAVGDTLQAVRAHGYESPLTSPGEADLSVHVNFFDLASALHRAGLLLDGPVTQSEFLGSLGLIERASRLMAANPARAAEIEAGVARLIAPGGMGTRFKVLAARSPGLSPLPGFAAAASPPGHTGNPHS